jgi:hypothetical protein
MDPVIIFACIFVPTFALNMLGAGRDEILFETKPKTSRWLVLLFMALAVTALLVVGLPLAWAVALVLPGPLASALGDWVGSGDWIVLRHRIGRLFGRRD